MTGSRNRSVFVRWSHSSVEKGFTLIEILIVLLILGIALSMVSVNMGGLEKRKQQQAGRQLLALMDAIRIQATVNQRKVSIDIANNRCQVLLEAATVPHSRSKSLIDFCFVDTAKQNNRPDNLDLSLNIRPAHSSASLTKVSRITFYPSGNYTAFEISGTAKENNTSDESVSELFYIIGNGYDQPLYCLQKQECLSL